MAPGSIPRMVSIPYCLLCRLPSCCCPKPLPALLADTTTIWGVLENQPWKISLQFVGKRGCQSDKQPLGSCAKSELAFASEQFLNLLPMTFGKANSQTQHCSLMWPPSPGSWEPITERAELHLPRGVGITHWTQTAAVHFDFWQSDMGRRSDLREIFVEKAKKKNRHKV